MHILYAEGLEFIVDLVERDLEMVVGDVSKETV